MDNKVIIAMIVVIAFIAVAGIAAVTFGGSGTC